MRQAVGTQEWDEINKHLTKSLKELYCSRHCHPQLKEIMMFWDNLGKKLTRLFIRRGWQDLHCPPRMQPGRVTKKSKRRSGGWSWEPLRMSDRRATCRQQNWGPFRNILYPKLGGPLMFVPQNFKIAAYQWLLRAFLSPSSQMEAFIVVSPSLFHYFTWYVWIPFYLT